MAEAMAHGSGLEEYFKTSFEDKLLVAMPEEGSSHLTQATKLLEKRRETSEVEQALTRQKDEFQMKMEALQQRRDELEHKEQKLKESLLKFDKFVKESDMKRGRALKKTRGEQELCRQKEREIAKLDQEIAELKVTVNRQKQQILQYAVYQKFMLSLLQHSPEFDEAREIITRYDALKQTREDLMQKEQQNQDAIEEEKASMLRFTEEKNNEILSCNNELAHLQSTLEKVQGEAMQWDSEWTRIQTTAAKKTLMLGQIKMATHNLYALVCKHLHKKIPPQDSGQTLAQLDKIQIFIKEMREIAHTIKRDKSAQLPNMQLLQVHYD